MSVFSRALPPRLRLERNRAMKKMSCRTFCQISVIAALSAAALVSSNALAGGGERLQISSALSREVRHHGSFFVRFGEEMVDLSTKGVLLRPYFHSPFVNG